MDRVPRVSHIYLLSPIDLLSFRLLGKVGTCLGHLQRHDRIEPALQLMEGVMPLLLFNKVGGCGISA